VRVVSGPRFVAVPADRLLAELREIGALVTGKGGRFIEGKQGREVVVDVVPPGGRAMVRVYTSLAAGAREVRDCGEDAVRLVVGVDSPERFRPIGDSQKILRTAPTSADDRVATFLARLREEIRQAYVRAKSVPACPLCGRAMAIRTQKATGRRFYGCTGFPECRGTMDERSAGA
jgi:hypothetical protein